MGYTARWPKTHDCRYPSPATAIQGQVDEQVITLLQHCAPQAQSKQALLAALGLSNVYLNYKRHIVPLLEHGLIAMTLPDKPQSCLQRYRLTPQGQALLNALNTKETSARCNGSTGCATAAASSKKWLWVASWVAGNSTGRQMRLLASGLGCGWANGCTSAKTPPWAWAAIG